MRWLLASSLAASSSLLALPALAIDCPPGSVSRAQDGYTFCEPTVCQNDGQCSPGEVCRPYPLCMQVGTLDVDAATLGTAAPKRLVVTQACGPDRSCPQTTTCSELGRCLGKDTAARLGLLTPKAIGSATPEAPAAPPKRSCGCAVIGADRGAAPALGALALGLLATIRAARGRRARSPRAR